MLSEEKRGLYGGNSYLSNKINNETEYEVRIRIIKQKYEERLEAITEKVKFIYEDIRKDEVISIMRSDPASSAFVSQRMKEICEDHLALEREETIDRLTEDVSLAQMESKKLEKDIRDLKSALESVHETLQADRQRLQSLDQENKLLRNKLSAFTKEFEDVHKKNLDDTCEALKNTSEEAERLKEALDRAERNLWQKATEYEILVHETNEKKDKIENLAVEINQINLELTNKDKVILENKQTIDSLKKELFYYKKDKEDQISHGKQIKDVIETEEKSHNDIIKEINLAHKEKCSRFKRKIIEQKKIMTIYENELNLAKEASENIKMAQERSMTTAQDDLKKVKDQWEKRCKDIEKEHSTQISEIQSKHQAQIAELQRHYQELLEDRIKDFQAEHSSHLSRQKALDHELKRIMDEKVSQIEKEYISISKHESILHEEASKLRIKNLQEIRDIEEKYNKEILIKIKDIKEQNLEDTQRLTQKILLLEQEKSECLSGKRLAESELMFTQEGLNNRIFELKKELQDCESQKKEFYKKSEEYQNMYSKLKSQYEEELNKRKQIENEIESEKIKSNSLMNSLSEAEKEFIFKHQHESASYQEKIESYEETLSKEQQKLRKSYADLDHYQNLSSKLQKEIEELKESHAQELQRIYESTQKSKAEEFNEHEKEIENHLETKRQLIQAEHKAKFLASEVEANEKLVNELRVLINKYEKDIFELRRNVTNLENSASHYEKASSKLRKDLERSKEDQNSLKNASKQAFKDSLNQLRSELKALSKNSVQEMINFKKNMSFGMNEALLAIEDYKNNSKRLLEETLYLKEEALSGLLKQKLEIEEELNQSLHEKNNYEVNIETLRMNINQLQSELSQKNQDLYYFSKKLEAFQHERTALEQENHRLEEELRYTYSSLESYLEGKG